MAPAEDTVDDADQPTEEAVAADDTDTDTDTDTDESAAGDDDDAVTGLESVVRPPPAWKRYVRPGLVAAAFVAAIGLAGGLGWQLWQQHQVGQATDAARASAVNYAHILTSIDSNKVDDNFAAVLNGATGDFKDMYTKSSVQLRQLLIDNKATAEGSVAEDGTATAIKSASKNEVVVLLMVDQKVTNTARPDPRVDRIRMEMTMKNVDGRWLASKVELP